MQSIRELRFRIIVFLQKILVKIGVIRLLAITLKPAAITGIGSDACLKEGYLPLPVHFYSPVPNLDDLKRRNIWEHKSSMPGIDFRAEEQVSLLRALGRHHAQECKWPLDPAGGPADFFLNNSSFSFGCAASTHCIIRHFRPRRIIEVGSGMSSRVINQALKLNNAPSQYTIIDPYPVEPVLTGLGALTKLIPERVELQDELLFSSLEENDILFIDSGHTVKIGGDVNFLFLDVLPRLSPGVIVHVHDIGLPYEYAKVYATREANRCLWTEQYLLQAFLCYNADFEIMLAMSYLMLDHMDAFTEAFPAYPHDRHASISGSFWFRRKIKPSD